MPSIPDTDRLHEALLRGLHQWMSARGSAVFPCRLGNLQGDLQHLNALFSVLGQPLSASELVELCQYCDRQIRQVRPSAGDKWVVRYKPAPAPRSGFACQIAIASSRENPTTEGSWLLPCVPALDGYYAQQLARLFDVLGQPLSARERQQLQAGLAKELETGFRASPYSRVVIRYQSVAPPGKGFTCGVKAVVQTLEERCQHLVATHTEPLFGRHADAKVMAVARSLGDPAANPILDIGAGTGRNTLPLARLGHPVDALELAPAFVDRLQTALELEALPGRAMRGDILDPQVALPRHRYRAAILSEVLPHFHSEQQLRSLMERMVEAIASGGLLLFSTFLAADGYEPDNLTLQMSRVTDSFPFTRLQLALALKNLPLQLISDESVVEYEQTHLPPSAWPPTVWFEGWASGRRLFALARERPPIELRWILCQHL